MDIERLEAHTLSEDIRQTVLTECRKKAAPDIFTICFDILFLLTFGRGALLIIQAAMAVPDKWYIGLLAVPFAAFPVILTYSTLIRPGKLVKMARANDYTYYIGTLTNKKKVSSKNAKGRTVCRYYLIVDKAVRCSCTETQYKSAAVGDQYAAVFFDKEEPEFCIKVTQKDII